ncbi:hypothetical protein WMY93_016478 [Mugilogobius chulae]|uniref:Olfactomedin-like domain-containing protein n=1 Tax=Mugilogobius chulae TaxID=88201 RepID=A0AAW0NKY2_9GOBI
MIGTLYFLALLGSTLAWGRVDVWSEAATRNGTEDGGGCTCDAFLPSAVFPIKDLVLVEETAKEISHELDLEIGKLEEFEMKMTIYAEKIVKLTAKVTLIEKNPDDFSDADLEEIKVEIKQVEALIEELQISIKSSTTVFESLRVQITIMISTLDKLEKTYDKNLVLATRREYIEIQLQLEECEKRHQEIFNPNIDSTKGKMVVAKINEASFGIEEEWPTSVYKPGVSNAFMVCGVLYAVKTIDIHTEEIFYMFDTKTKKESYVNVPFERFQDKYSNLDYNPTDQKLYMYNDGYYVSYHLWFNQTAPAEVKLPAVQNENVQNVTENVM